MKERQKPTNPGDQTVAIKASDAQRIASAVLAHERSRRGRKPSWLPRAPGGGGGGGEIRLAQFSGQWQNEAPNNIKVVQLFRHRPQPLPGQSVVSPFDWIPEFRSDGSPEVAVTLNWLAHIPATPGDNIRWCAVTPISDIGGEYHNGEYEFEEIGGVTLEVPVMESYGKLWLLLSAEC